MGLSGKLFMCSAKGYFGLHILNCQAMREIYTKIIPECVQKQCIPTLHALLYLLHNMMSPWMTIKRRFLPINIMPPLVCLCSGDDIIITQRSCWWVYWFHSVHWYVRLSVRPSVHPSRIPCLLCSAYSFGWIHFIFIHLIKQLKKGCCI